MRSNDVTDNEKEEEEMEFKSFTHYETPSPAKVQHFYISTVVERPDKYVDMIHRIKLAGPHDVIYIYLNTPGGHIDTGVQLISAMNVSQAHIVTVLEGEVCSLGTLIFLAGKEFIVHDNCLFMIHNFSGGVYGKGHEQKAQLDATIKWFTKLATETYEGFLSESELKDMIKGNDLWYGSDEVRERLERMVKLQEKKLLLEEKVSNKVAAKKKTPKKKVAKKKTKKKVAKP